MGFTPVRFAGVAGVFVVAGRGVVGARTGVLTGVVTVVGIEARGSEAGGPAGVVVSTGTTFTFVFDPAAGTSLTTVPLVHILARFSRLNSISMTFRRGFSGVAGGMIFLPFIFSSTN